MRRQETALAIHGGKPVRETLLPYGRQQIDDDDIQAVVDVLRSDWLTTGPKVAEFEGAFAEYVGSEEAVAVCNGTAALHAAVAALGIAPGDEVIVPAMTFAASANCVVYQGGTPVFADVDAETLLIDPLEVEAKITSQTKAVVAVDYAGQPADYDVLLEIADRHGIAVISDACHALGASYKGRKVGTLSNLSAFSLHPVKHITAGEGGVVTTNDPTFATQMRIFRNHGITSDHRQRESAGSWFYEMVNLGFNYRLTDFQCALATSQLKKLDGWIDRRQEIAARFDGVFAELPAIRPLKVMRGVSHAYHLYVIRLDANLLRVARRQVFAALRAEGIGGNVHYIPVHLHPFYRNRFGTAPGMCPTAEAVYEDLLTLPMFAGMNDDDVEDVIEALIKVTRHYGV